MYFARFIIFLGAIVCSSFSADVKWLPSTSFNLPINFSDGKLPCSRKTVVFSESQNSSITFEADTSVSGFILPMDGEFIFGDGMSLEFGVADDNCTVGKVYYMDKSISSWAQPDVWDSPKFNKATPDAERVPCQDDVVKFPKDKGFSVLLPYVTQKIRGLAIGDEWYDTDKFKEYILRNNDHNQQFFLTDYEDTGVSVEYNFCLSPAGCPCQKNVLDIDCEAKFCPVPSCVQPIQPVGHCCKICGGVFILNIDQSFRIAAFYERVDEIISSYRKGELIYHIGRIPNDRLQLVVVESKEYTGTSAEVVNTIANNIEWHLDSKLQISGIPTYKSGMGGKIFVSIFFIVILVMSGIYVYYYKVSGIRIPIIGQPDFSLFSRYDRRSESVVSLTRRSSIAPVGTTAATAFQNPLYDSKRSRTSIESYGDE